MRRLILSLLVGLLAACASTPPAPPPRLPAFRVAPADFGAPLQLVQRLQVLQLRDDQRAPKERQLDTLLQLDGEALRLAALALNQRVLTLVWDGRELQVQRHPLLPAEVDPERVLRDIALVFAPLSALRQGLGPEWALSDSEGRRELRLNGQLLLVVHYLQGREQVEIDNRAERYRLRIESRAAEGAV
ncbi:MAG: DUF3261 domain-containing protein [Inhella sp.]